MADNNSWWQDNETVPNQDSWWKYQSAKVEYLNLKQLVNEIKIEALGLKYSLDNSIFTKNSMSNSVNNIISKCNQVK